MKLPFKFKNIHSCEAVVLSCIDFRFWRETVKFVESEPSSGGLGIKNFDFPSLPGAAKAINECPNNEDLAMKCITVPGDLHHVKKIIIVNHQDCGAYGGSVKFNGDHAAEQTFHEQELKQAGEKLSAKYPDKEIFLIYAKLKEGEEVDFIRV